MRHVIIGAGPAGVIAAETLRGVDAGARITLISGEPGPPYSRMAIPYFLTGRIDAAGTHLRKSKNHYQDLNIKLVEGRVAKVHPKKGELALEAGTKLPFDRLLVASGASAVAPPVPGLDGAGVHHCWTLEDAHAIAALAAAGTEVVLMGAGFIGCIVLEALVRRGVKLTVVERESRMLPRMMDKAGGQILKSWCQAKGVRVLTGAQVTGVEDRAQGGKWVKLKGARKLAAGLVVVATGVAANMGFLKSSRIKCAAGVLVDGHMRTSAENVFAAGDVAQGLDFSTGNWSVHAIQPTAAEHGRVAGLNMAGRDARYQGSLIMNVLDTLGLVSCSFGRWQGIRGGDVVEATNRDGRRHIRLAFADDRLIGALSLGRTDQIGALRGLIQSRRALGPWKDRLVRDPHRFAEAFAAGVA